MGRVRAGNVTGMRWDREPAAARQKFQDSALRTYLAREVYAFSPYYRGRFDAAGVNPATLKDLGEVSRLPSTPWADLAASPFELVLRPDEESIAHFGHRRLVWAVTLSKLRGNAADVNRDVIERAYKPIHWHLDTNVPIGSTFEDVERLSKAGHRTLAVAGLSRYDVLVTATAPTPSLEYWQIVYGARAAGISALHLGYDVDPVLVVAAAPTVLAGSSAELLSLLSGLSDLGRELPDLHLLLVVGELPDDATRAELRTAGRAIGRADTDVVAAWAPPGVRAMWAQCRSGEGLHTYPDFEWIEVVDGSGNAAASGELLWTSIGWRGTALFRLQTSLRVSVRDETCPACQRVGPRVFTSAADALVSGEAAATLERPAGLVVAVPPPPPAPVAPPPAPVAPPPAPVAPPPVAAPPEPAPAPAPAHSRFGRRRSAAVPVPETSAPAISLDDDEDEGGDEFVALPTPARVAEGIDDDLVPPELQFLDRHDGVAAWQAEYRTTDDGEELLVFLAPAANDHPGPLCRELDEDLRATQYVVLSRDAVEARVARAGLVLDLRD